MKLKQRPEDFQVDEQTAALVDANGPYAFYRLKKRGMGTPEAIHAICQKLAIKPRNIAHGGLKDRHALTTQHLTIVHGPRKNLDLPDLQLKYLGQRSEPFKTTDVTANRFHVVLRSLAPDALASAQAALEEVRVDGVPNYFDDQRFGSVGASGRFIARCLIEGKYEEAVRMALAEPYAHDAAPAKREKELLRKSWGNWGQLQDRLPKGEAKLIAAHLAGHPNDFRGAVARLRTDLKSIYLNAYQSHLWNQLLAKWLQKECHPEQLFPVELRLGPMPFVRRLDETQRAPFHAMSLPLPSARLKLPDQDPIKPIVDEVMAWEGLKLEDLKLKHFREPFFSKGDRKAFLRPEGLSSSAGDDDLNPGQRTLTLRFDLPRGCYATMVVKRVTAFTVSA